MDEKKDCTGIKDRINQLTGKIEYLEMKTDELTHELGDILSPDLPYVGTNAMVCDEPVENRSHHVQCIDTQIERIQRLSDKINDLINRSEA